MHQTRIYFTEIFSNLDIWSRKAGYFITTNVMKQSIIPYQHTFTSYRANFSEWYTPGIVSPFRPTKISTPIIIIDGVIQIYC